MDPLPAELLRQVLARLERIESLLLRSALTPAQREVVRLVAEVFGSAAFTSAELVAALDAPFGERPRLRAALQTLVSSLKVQAVGDALGAIAREGSAVEGVRLVTPKRTSGRRLWCIEVA